MSDGKDAPVRKVYPANMTEYVIYQLIGVGAFAKVYRAEVKETKEPVAIKLIDLGRLQASWEEVQKEVMAMKKTNHKNVVHIHTAFVEGPVMWIVMPMMGAGSCASILKSHFPKGIKDEALLATILREILYGLIYFHKDRRIHRDVKAGNILVSGDGEIKLADFGVATALNDSQQKRKAKTFTGTPCWMAPEVMEQAGGYNCKADIWSFGITAMELAFGKPPYYDFQPMKVLLTTLQNSPPTIDVYVNDDTRKKFSSAFRSMLSKCLQKDPSKRPTSTKLLTHRFFSKAKDQKYIVKHLLEKVPKATIGGTPLELKPEELAQHPYKGAGTGHPVTPVPNTWIFDEEEVAKIRKARSLRPEADEGKADGGTFSDSSSEEGEDEGGEKGGTSLLDFMGDAAVSTVANYKAESSSSGEKRGVSMVKEADFLTKTHEQED